MTIERADIEKLAELARIELNEATIAETTKSIADVPCPQSDRLRKQDKL